MDNVLRNLNGHRERVCFLSWSPCGKYMATSGLDKQLLWKVGVQPPLIQKLFQESISCIAWKPKGYVLAVIDVMGQLMVFNQEPFQPGDTPVQPGERHFLCRSLGGYIIAEDLGNSFHIEINQPSLRSLFNSNYLRRIYYFGCPMASLNEGGYVLANPCKGGMSLLTYVPHSVEDGEWSMVFEEEEVIKAVALGSTWVAAATNHNNLHIFTMRGEENHKLKLDGAVVTMVGFNEKLAVVAHSSSSLVQTFLSPNVWCLNGSTL